MENDAEDAGTLHSNPVFRRDRHRRKGQIDNNDAQSDGQELVRLHVFGDGDEDEPKPDQDHDGVAPVHVCETGGIDKIEEIVHS